MTPVLTPATAREVLREARVRLAHARTPLLATAALTLLSAVGALGLPFAVRHVVDAGIRGGDAAAVRTGVLAAAALVAVAAVADRGRLLVAARLAEGVLAALRADLARTLLALQPRDLRGVRRGELVSRAVGDVEVLDEAVRAAAPELLRAGLLLVLGGAALVVLSPPLGALAAVGALAVVLAARRLLRRTRRIYAAQREAEALALAELSEGATAARDLRLLRAGARAVERVDAAGAGLEEQEHAARRARNAFFPLVVLCQTLAVAAVLGAGAALNAAGQVTVGTVAAVALAVPALYGPLDDAVAWLDECGSAGAAAARVVAALRLRPGLAPGTQPALVGARLTARGVGFGYQDGPPLLRDVDLDVAPGERVALVGRSGAGKSTLARLLVRLEDPDAGVVRLGGDDLRDLDPGDLRRRVVLLPQGAPLPGPTPRLAAAAVRPDSDDADLRRAAALAGAPLPDDLDDWWGPGGRMLPAPDRQRIGLALVLLADPDVVVLDEPTSALPGHQAVAVEQATSRALAGRAVVVVAHRLDTALASDRVVVLDDGRVVESGRPADLLDAGGPFACLVAAGRVARPTG